MSFSSELKEEIISSSVKSPCCRRALLQGVIAARGIADGGEISVSLESDSLLSYLTPLVKEFYGRDAVVTSSSVGGRRRLLCFKSASCERFISALGCGVSGALTLKCPSCGAYFLKGVFLACGRASDPKKQYCLEFSAANRQDALLEYFGEVGLSLKARTRGSENIIYTRNSTSIEDFFGLADIQSAAFEIINTKIAKDFMNNANRGRNLDTVNIRKAVETGNEQAKILSELDKRGLMRKLPDDLIRTARLRMEYPDYTLNQLAIHSVPPLTKSGVVHRLSKIMKIAKELLNN